MDQPEVQATMVCDVDTDRRTAAKARVDKHYNNTDCKAVNDFREITENPNIDAVCIAVPDHWHAFISISALEHGKDVYCEKPLTHNIHEAIAVTKAARDNKRVLQTGSMQRSMAEFRVACELVRNGVIGKITKIDTSFGNPAIPFNLPEPAIPFNLPEEPMQPGLDWDRWCGPGPLVHYNSILSPRGLHNHFPLWREVREFGGGYICDWGAHHIDIAQWGLGMDENGPVEVVPPSDWQSPKARGAQLIYADGTVLTHVNGKGVTFYGTEGEISVNRGKFEFARNDGKKFRFWEKEQDKGTSLVREYTLAEREYLKDAKISLYKSKDQIQDFLACVKSREKPVCDVGIGASSAIACHLMNFAYYHGAHVKWNPTKHKFISGGDDKWLTREYRGEWKVA
jgi:predicted dehydrogenase